MMRHEAPQMVDKTASASISAMFEGDFLADLYEERPKEVLGENAVWTRSPPEPNGYLHLGHSKAIAINFGFARYHGGRCILCFDDTNPMGEEAVYYTAIEEVIEWLYELAEELIKADGACACHCSDEQIKAHRGLVEGKWGGKRTPCEHRSRPIADSLGQFKAMRDGKYAYQAAVLRMKQNLQDNNLQMWDLAAYRISKESKPHHRTGDRWKIYPTYDFAHCLCDSIEKVTHSLCTTELELSRKYLEVLVPRLLVVLDPIRIIIDNLPNDYEEMVEIPYSKDRNFGSRVVPFSRTVYIERSDLREQDSKDFYRLAPGKSVGLLKVPFPITATSFEKDAETGLVTLIHAEYTQPSADGKFKKPKAYIHWVGQSEEHKSPVKATIRLHNPIFNLADPDAHPDGFLAALNTDSEEIFENSMIDVGFHEIRQKAPWPAEAGERSFAAGEPVRPETVRFQGMRTAYFCVDEDSTSNNIILNRIVSLKEDNAKKG